MGDRRGNGTRGWPDEAFTEEERNSHVERSLSALRELARLSRGSTPGRKGAGDDAAFDRVRDMVSALWDEYAERTPFFAMSRCPISGNVAHHSFDPWGLDGLWWNSDNPCRPVERQLATFFLLSGAVRLEEPVEAAPFLCKPGPEVPFVVPRLLARPEIRAVVSSFGVGRHEAFPVFYYAESRPAIEPINTWGLNHYSFLDESGWERWEEVPEDPADLDFNLERWIRPGKLQWIAPGDDQLRLQSGVNGCPYLDLPGRRERLRIQDGEVWGG